MDFNVQDYMAGVQDAVAAHLPGRTAVALRDRGQWVRHIFEVTLDNGDVVFLKVAVPMPGWLEGGETHEQDVAELFAAHNVDSVVPPVLAMDTSCRYLPHPYVIQARRGGRKLGEVLRHASDDQGAAICEAVGRFYAQMHAIHNDRDGLWSGSTPDRPWGAPTDHMYQAEIVEGSGRQALEKGCISRETYDRAVRLWQENLIYLKDHQPALIHMSPFWWTIYVEEDADRWRVVKLTSVGDVLWWDAAFDIACLQYPPFGTMRPAWRAGFVRGYGSQPERKRLLLYLVMQRLCGAMGTYMAPETPEHATWSAQVLQELPALLDEIERLG